MPKINVFFNLGWDPPTRTSRQNVAAAICHVDCQIVAWPAVKGHRRRHTHRLRKNNRCDTFANIIFQLEMRDSDIVNLTNGGKNGITIRLHNNLYRRLEQTGPRSCSKFLLDYVFHRPKGNHGKEQNRDYVQDPIFTKIGNGSLDAYAAFKRGEENSEPTGWLQNQCWRTFYQKIYEQMDDCQKRSDHGSSSEGGRKWTIGPLPLTKLFLVSKSSPRKNLSKDGNHQRLAFGLCSWITGQRKRSEILVNLSTTELKFLLVNYLKNISKNNKINRFPLTTWASNRPGFFYIYKI